MDPWTIIQIIGVVLSAYSAYTGAVIAQEQAEFQKDVAKANAKTAEDEAIYAREQADKQEGEHRKKVAGFLSTQRAKQASSGLVVGEGSFGDILDDTAALGEVDAMAIRHEGDLAGWRARQKAANLTAQSQLYTGSGFDAFASGGGTLLTGLSGIDWD